jgi:6-pyruvoyltetrahydropterin/6-carboxytetrahydropterin synthase
MFEVSVTGRFSAAHHLRGYRGSCAEHHGHNWKVRVFVAGRRLNRAGMLMDFRELREAVESVLKGLDHTDLSGLDFFRTRNPTSEHLARFLYRELASRVNCRGYRLRRVSVQETPGSEATYSEP